MRFLTCIGFPNVYLTSFTVCYFFLEKYIDLSAFTVLCSFNAQQVLLVGIFYCLLVKLLYKNKILFRCALQLKQIKLGFFGGDF